MSKGEKLSAFLCLATSAIGLGLWIKYPNSRMVANLLLIFGLVCFAAFLAEFWRQEKSPFGRFQSFLAHKIKQGHSYRVLPDTDESFALAKRWFSNTHRGIGRGLGESFENGFKSERNITAQLFYLDPSGRHGGPSGPQGRPIQTVANYDKFFESTCSYLEQIKNEIEPSQLVAGFKPEDLEELKDDHGQG